MAAKNQAPEPQADGDHAKTFPGSPNGAAAGLGGLPPVNEHSAPAPAPAPAARENPSASQQLQALRQRAAPIAAENPPVSPQLQALRQRAALGAKEDVERLGQWGALLEHEVQLLRHRSLKQQHDFNTLMEIVGQTSARTLAVGTMETYLLRTVSGHFATPKLLIMRRARIEDHDLICSCAQGVHEPNFVVPVDSPLCQAALEQRACFSIGALAKQPAEVQSLLDWGLDLAVPLLQEVEGRGAVLEGMLLLGPRLAGRYSGEDIEFLHTLARMSAICLRNEALYRRSIIDDLTGVASRGHFDARLNQELNRILVYGHRGLGLLMLDVDNFKNFNDRHGHQTGDRVLQELARALVRQVRNVDLVARYGGEEFSIILLEIERPKVVEVAERLCRSVAQTKVLSARGETLSITASFGLACFPEDALDKSTLIHLADEALYNSKLLGKNRVTVVEPGAGRNRATLGPAPIGSALQSPVIASASTKPPPPQRSPALTAGAFPPEVESLRQRRQELAGADSSAEPGQSNPRQEDRRGSGLHLPPGEGEEAAQNP